MPFISVIIPVFNVEKYLKKCTDSVLNQSFKDFEIILVNDTSTDNSGKICKEYATKYKNKIKLINQEKNMGQGEARNTGLENSSGEYVLFLDGDDYIETDMLEILQNHVKLKNCEILVFGFKSVSESGKLLKKHIDDIEKNKITNLEQNPEILFCSPSVCNKLFERKFLIKTQLTFLPNAWYEDFRFTNKIWAKAKKICFIEYYGYNYLFRQGSTMNNKNLERNAEILLAMEDIILFYKQNKLFTRFKQELEFLAIFYVYITTCVRIININITNDLFGKINKYMIENFPNFKKNKYLTKLTRNEKIIYKLLNIRQYRLIYFIFKIKNNFKK